MSFWFRTVSDTGASSSGRWATPPAAREGGQNVGSMHKLKYNIKHRAMQHFCCRMCQSDFVKSNVNKLGYFHVLVNVKMAWLTPVMHTCTPWIRLDNNKDLTKKPRDIFSFQVSVNPLPRAVVLNQGCLNEFQGVTRKTGNSLSLLFNSLSKPSVSKNYVWLFCS